MSRVAIYPGSFDPVTDGHVDVIRRGAGLFDRLLVGVGNNPAKKYWFNLDERRQMIAEATAGFSNVEVVSFEGLIVDACRRLEVPVILRGLRALSDFDLEFRNGLANRDLSGVETLFLLTDPQNIFVSSSLVREIAQNGGDVSHYVPVAVLAAIERKRGLTG
jgi:pantetheine-phosphate adenylyltransferase